MKTADEVDTFIRALNRLNDRDRTYISKEADNLSNNIRGFGHASAMELLGKIAVLTYVNDELDQPQIKSYGAALKWAEDKIKVKKDQNDT